MGSTERGSFRPVWIAVAIVTCVVFGSTVNRCLTCARPQPAAVPVASVLGSPFLERKAEGAAGEAEAPGGPAAGPEEPAPPAIDLAPKRPLPMPATEPSVEPARPAGLEDHEDITFDKLASYVYEVQELKEGETPKDQIPESVRALNDRKIAIRGFMIPYRNDGEKVTEFILLRNQGLCCFGIVPRMNEWIHVRMAPGDSAPYATDVPITVFGRLEIGEQYEKGALMSVYRMESSLVLAPPVYR